MPSIVDSSDPAVLDYCQSFKQDPDDQTPIATEPLFPWHEYHQSTTIGQESFAPTETSYPTPQITRFSRAPEAQATSRQAVWSYKTQQEDCFPHQSATNQLYNPFRLNHGFTGSVSAHSSMQRPLLPLPLRQRRTWTDSTVTNTMNQMLISNPQSSPSFPYDAANQMAPGIYSTTSDCHPSFRPDMRPSHMDLGDDMTANSCETDGESKDGSPPYAKLIYQALMAAPGHKLILRDIYAWIAQNTDKAKNPMNKGWQNSVRHNLSMNGVKLFEFAALWSLLTIFSPSKRSILLIPTINPRRVTYGFSTRLQWGGEYNRRPDTDRSPAKSMVSQMQWT